MFPSKINCPFTFNLLGGLVGSQPSKPGRMGVNPIWLVRSNPKPMCSFARYLLEKMAILAAHLQQNDQHSPNWFLSWKWPNSTTKWFKWTYSICGGPTATWFIWFLPPVTQPQQRWRRKQSQPRRRRQQKPFKKKHFQRNRSEPHDIILSNKPRFFGFFLFGTSNLFP